MPAQDVRYRWIVAGLYGVEKSEIRIMFREGFKSFAVILPDLVLIVNVCGGSVLCCDIPYGDIPDMNFVLDYPHVCSSPVYDLKIVHSVILQGPI